MTAGERRRDVLEGAPEPRAAAGADAEADVAEAADAVDGACEPRADEQVGHDAELELSPKPRTTPPVASPPLKPRSPMARFRRLLQASSLSRRTRRSPTKSSPNSP